MFVPKTVCSLSSCVLTFLQVNGNQMTQANLLVLQINCQQHIKTANQPTSLRDWILWAYRVRLLWSSFVQRQT